MSLLFGLVFVHVPVCCGDDENYGGPMEESRDKTLAEGPSVTGPSQDPSLRML